MMMLLLMMIHGAANTNDYSMALFCGMMMRRMRRMMIRTIHMTGVARMDSHPTRDDVRGWHSFGFHPAADGL
jgi:hypothetical protein